jgi:hypothetical protein
MAYNLQEIRRFIRQQKEIILYYRTATDAADEATEWLEKNEELQSDQNTAPKQEEFKEAIQEKSTLFKLPKFLGGE